MSSTLSSVYLPSTPYLRAHMSLLSAQVGASNAALYPNVREDDDDVTRLIKRQLKREMQDEERRRQRDGDDGDDLARSSPPNEDDLAYPFTQHSAALRQHVLMLSAVQSTFAELRSTLSSQPALQRLLGDLASSYLSLFSGLLASLFALNSHYHLRLHRLSFSLQSLRSAHAHELSALEERVHLLTASTRTTDALQQLEARQREHHVDLIQSLTATLRSQAVAAMPAGRQDAVDVVELGHDASLHAHHLSLLLDALDHERAEGDDSRDRLDRLLVEGKRSARELWMNTLHKKREDAAEKAKEKKDRERRQLLAIHTSPSTPRPPSSPLGFAFAVGSHTALPVLSRFLYSAEGPLSARPTSSVGMGGATSLASLNAQLLSVVVALSSSAAVGQFPSHVLSIVLSANPSVVQAQKHLLSLLTNCTLHRTSPLPQLCLPLLMKAEPTALSSSSSSSSREVGRVSSFTLQMVACGVRYFRPVLDKELSLSPAALQSHVMGLLSLFFQPASFPLHEQLMAFVAEQPQLPSISVLPFLLHFGALYGAMLVDWMRLMGGGRVGLDEVDAMMREADRPRWEKAAKEDKGRVYAAWIERCVDDKAEGEADELYALLDVLCLRGWWLAAT